MEAKGYKMDSISVFTPQTQSLGLYEGMSQEK